MHNSPAAKSCLQGLQRRCQSADPTCNLRSGSHVHIVLGEVDAGFEQRDQFNQSLFHRRYTPAERSAQLAGCLSCLRQGLRLNQVTHRLCLG